MKLSTLDKSNYFKGLLLLIKKDKRVSDNEREIMIKFGKTLGFDKDFYESAIESILFNEYVLDNPPVFSQPQIAESFIIDGLKVAYSDREAADSEINWLKTISDKNSLSSDWFNQQISKLQKSVENIAIDKFEVTRFI